MTNRMNIMRTTVLTDRNQIDRIISQCDICFVGMNGEDGVPYVIPMNFGYDGSDFILHSAREGKHLKLLAADNRVSLTFCTERTLRCQHPDVACSYSMESASVLCTGVVSFVPDDDLDEKARALNVLMRNYVSRDFVYSEPALRNVKVWKVKAETLTAIAKVFGQNFRNRQAPEGLVKRGGDRE